MKVQLSGDDLSKRIQDFNTFFNGQQFKTLKHPTQVYLYRQVKVFSELHNKINKLVETKKNLSTLIKPREDQTYLTTLTADAYLEHRLLINAYREKKGSFEQIINSLETDIDGCYGLKFNMALGDSQKIRNKALASNSNPRLFSEHLQLLEMCIKHPKSLNLLQNNGFTESKLHFMLNKLVEYRDCLEEIAFLKTIEKIHTCPELQFLINMKEEKSQYILLTLQKDLGIVIAENATQVKPSEKSLIYKLQQHQSKEKKTAKTFLGRLANFIVSKLYALLYGRRDAHFNQLLKAAQAVLNKPIVLEHKLDDRPLTSEYGATKYQALSSKDDDSDCKPKFPRS